MPTPRDPTARFFYRAARQRLLDAEFLYSAQRFLGAVYLAGYAVECLLKALILGATPDAGRADVLDGFRGARAHDYAWLRERYYATGAARFPPAVAEAFANVAFWGTHLRYQPGTIGASDAAAFLTAVDVIRVWADERL